MKVFDFEGLARFDLLRKVDGGLHAIGLPHMLDAPATVRALVSATVAVRRRQLQRTRLARS